MTELSWPPDVVGRLTVDQLACLASDRPPGDPGGPKKTYEEMAAALAREEAEAAAWASSS